MLLTQGTFHFRHPARVMKTKSMILLTAALCGLPAGAMAAQQTPTGDAFADPKALPIPPAPAQQAAPEPNAPPLAGKPERRRSLDTQVLYETFSIDSAKAAAMRRQKPGDGKFYADMVAAVEKGEAAQESLMVVRCPSGQAAKVESVTRHEYPTEYNSPKPTVKEGEPADAKPEPTPVIPSAIENRNVGTMLEVEPTMGEKSPIIQLRIMPMHVGLAERTSWGKATSTTEMPIYESQNLNTSVMVLDGSPFLLGTISPPPDSKVHANKIWFAFVTVTSTKK